MTTMEVDRRTFIVTSASAAGGLVLGFYMPTGADAGVMGEPWTAAEGGQEVNAWLVIDPDNSGYDPGLASRRWVKASSQACRCWLPRSFNATGPRFRRCMPMSTGTCRTLPNPTWWLPEQPRKPTTSTSGWEPVAQARFAVHGCTLCRLAPALANVSSRRLRMRGALIGRR